MINGKSVLAIIPARGGSRRCPRKNVREFCGKPLLQWSVEQARASRYVDQIVVSTEDEEIAELAVWVGAFVLSRPPELATDEASTEEVVMQVCCETPWAQVVVLLQPTSPLRLPVDIDRCIALATEGGHCVSFGPDFKPNGAVYVWARELIMPRVPFVTEPRRYFMPAERSLDIDTPEDFERAERVARETLVNQEHCVWA